jgi:hypothetical protein
MYLAEVREWDVVKKQYKYKLKSFSSVFTSLVVIQVLAILFSFMGTSMSGGSDGNFSYDVNHYTGSLIFVFMMIWGLISAIIITSKAYRYDDYSFIANRVTSHYSNILFLVSASLFGAITIFLSTYLFQVIYILIYSAKAIYYEPLTVVEMAKGLCGTALYLILFTSIGYLIGTFVQIHRIFTFIIPIIVIGSIIIDGTYGNQTIDTFIFKFFGNESSLSLFTLKVFLSSFMIYTVSVLFSRRLEVKP